MKAVAKPTGFDSARAPRGHSGSFTAASSASTCGATGIAASPPYPSSSEPSVWSFVAPAARARGVREESDTSAARPAASNPSAARPSSAPRTSAAASPLISPASASNAALCGTAAAPKRPVWEPTGPQAGLKPRCDDVEPDRP